MTTDFSSSATGPVWFCKTNPHPYETNQSEEWTPYSPDVSKIVDRVYRCGAKEIFVKDEYRIDFEHMLQVHIDDSSRQRPIRRQNRVGDDTSQTESESEADRWRRERYSFPLDPDMTDNTIVDTKYHGSPFVTDWLISFTKGKLKMTFDRIFDVLVKGIRKEGQPLCERATTEIIDILQKNKADTTRKRNVKRIEKLQEICAKLYTKQCFLSGLINHTLLHNDHTKLSSLGPYCYLVYNHIGSRLTDYLSVRHRLRQQIRPTEARSMYVYRGDHVTREKIEEYRQAAGKTDKYFKWLPFVSTSLDPEVAERFGRNVLYEIELRRYTSNDQFINLKNNTFVEHEEEILIRPGVRFRVEEVTFDQETGRQRVKIKIVPSYVSNLR